MELTAREFDLLELLMRHPNRVYSREQLLNLVWGYEYTGEYRTVDVHIRRIREKVEADPANPTLCVPSGGWGTISTGTDRKGRLTKLADKWGWTCPTPSRPGWPWGIFASLRPCWC